MQIFVSVGTGLNPQQEEFVRAVEEKLRAVGLIPCTIGRNTFSTEAPLHAITTLMDRCAGAVIIALERYGFDGGVERRGSDKERTFGPVSFPTAWNQIEAAMAYARGLPPLVIVDRNLQCDGLLEKGNDWHVHDVAIDQPDLNGKAFNGLLEDWQQKLCPPKDGGGAAKGRPKIDDPAKLSLLELVGSVKLPQLWAALAAAAGVIGTAFVLGTKLPH